MLEGFDIALNNASTIRTVLASTENMILQRTGMHTCPPSSQADFLLIYR